MGGIGLMSGVLGALPGLGLLLLSVRGVLHMGGACETVIYNNLYYMVSVCCFLPVNLCTNIASFYSLFFGPVVVGTRSSMGSFLCGKEPMEERIPTTTGPKNSE